MSYMLFFKTSNKRYNNVFVHLCIVRAPQKTHAEDIRSWENFIVTTQCSKGSLLIINISKHEYFKFTIFIMIMYMPNLSKMMQCIFQEIDAIVTK